MVSVYSAHRSKLVVAMNGRWENLVETGGGGGGGYDRAISFIHGFSRLRFLLFSLFFSLVLSSGGFSFGDG